MKNDASNEIDKFGLDFNRILHFLKVECKIDIGFEAQLIGINAKSATTSGLIIYILALLTKLTDHEKAFYISEIEQFSLGNGFSDIYGTNYPCSWATMQVVLALIELDAPTDKVKRIIDSAIKKFHLKSGGWCFSTTEDEKLIYSIYPVLALIKASKKYSLDYSHILKITADYLKNLIPAYETEKVIIWGLLKSIQNLNIPNITDEHPCFIVDYHRIVKEEFGNYGVNEYTIYPFSMRLYTPALYLLSRRYLTPDHPFSLYLLKYLLLNIIDNKAWMHVSTNSPRKVCSYCTALSLLTLSCGLDDFKNNEIDSSLLIHQEFTLHELEIKMGNIKNPINIFISYSSKDEKITTETVKKLKSYGFDVTYAEFDLLVGDSIPGFINDGLLKMDYFIIFLSKTSVLSKFVKDEFEGAKAKEWLKEEVVILPVLLEKCSIPPILASKKWADFSKSYDEGLEELVNSIRRHHAKRKENL